MIVAISRFRVKNRMESDVAEAFQAWPRLVDDPPGFWGFEVLRDVKDPATFYLVTRWADVKAFRTWHGNDLHHASHSHIPKGLRLDASMTELMEAERVPGPSTLEDRIADAAPLLSNFLSQSETFHYIAAGYNGEIQECSPAVSTALACTRQELTGKALWDFLMDRDAGSLRQRIAKGGARSERFPLNFVSSDFHPFTLHCQLAVQSGGFVLIGERLASEESALQQELLRVNNELAVITRESARKSRELERANLEMQKELARRKQLMLEIEKSNGDLQRFADAASHDLMEPVRTVAGFSQLLHKRYKGQLDAEADEFLDFIVNGARRLYGLIDDLLVYSNAGSASQVREWVEMNEIVQEARMLLRRSIKETGATVEADADLPRVYGYRKPLLQLMENLIENGIHFRAEAPPAIRITAKTTGRAHCFTVADNGIGIPSEYLQTIFEAFRRLDNVATSGSGVGLALCRKIVERHGGAIWAESVPGHGSVFQFTLNRASEKHSVKVE